MHSTAELYFLCESFMSDQRPPGMTSSPQQSYAGDLSLKDSWERLLREETSQLVDVRTEAEWNFVGVPDMSGLKRRLLLCEWQRYPAGQNQDFVRELSQALTATRYRSGSALLFLCRSGARSRAAAIAMTAAGFAPCFNIKDGFEGALDDKVHRGQAAGWKAEGLPWIQS